MTCNREDIAYAWLDGALGAREAAEFERHLASCADCRILVHETRERERSLREVLTHLAAGCQIREKVLRRLPAEKILPAPTVGQPDEAAPSLLGWRLAFPSLLVLVFLAFLLQLSVPPDPTVGTSPTRFAAAVICGAGPDARVNGRVLPPGEQFMADPHLLLECQGPVEIRLVGGHAPVTTWNGTGRFSVSSDAITWADGNGTFGSLPGRGPVTIKADGTRFLLHEGELAFSRSAGTPLRVELKRGRAAASDARQSHDLAVGQAWPPADPLPSPGPAFNLATAPVQAPPAASANPAAAAAPPATDFRVAPPATVVATDTPPAAGSDPASLTGELPPASEPQAAPNPFSDENVVISQ